MKNENKLIDREKGYAFNLAPRCGARTKSNNGLPCKCPAIKGKKRCRVHGGAKRSGAQAGNKNALKHGGSTTEIKAFKKLIRFSIKASKEGLNEILEI